MTYVLHKASNVLVSCEGEPPSRILAQPGLRGRFLRHDYRNKRIVLSYAGDPGTVLEVDENVFPKAWQQVRDGSS
jgi:hypothetical protein